MEFFGKLSDYDLFAYLPQGFLALVAADYIIGTNYFSNLDWTAALAILATISSYIAGHLVAGPAATILENWLVKKTIKQPSAHLLKIPKRSFFRAAFFGNYFNPINDSLKTEVLKRLPNGSDPGGNGDALFWIAYPIARTDDEAKPRLSSFLNVYGFCRNLSFLLGATAVILFLQVLFDLDPKTDPDAKRTAIAILLATAAFFLFHRYLKFYRLYTIEVLLAFSRSAVIPPDRQSSQPA